MTTTVIERNPAISSWSRPSMNPSTSSRMDIGCIINPPSGSASVNHLSDIKTFCFTINVLSAFGWGGIPVEVLHVTIAVLRPSGLEVLPSMSGVRCAPGNGPSVPCGVHFLLWAVADRPQCTFGISTLGMWQARDGSFRRR